MDSTTTLTPSLSLDDLHQAFRAEKRPEDLYHLIALHSGLTAHEVKAEEQPSQETLTALLSELPDYEKQTDRFIFSEALMYWWNNPLKLWRAIVETPHHQTAFHPEIRLSALKDGLKRFLLVHQFTFDKKTLFAIAESYEKGYKPVIRRSLDVAQLFYRVAGALNHAEAKARYMELKHSPRNFERFQEQSREDNTESLSDLVSNASVPHLELVLD